MDAGIFYTRREATLDRPGRLELDLKQIPSSERHAYALVREEALVRGSSWAAWKLGGTTAATRAAFSVSSLYFGPLLRTEVLIQPRIISTRQLVDIKGEIEIALRLSPSVGEMAIDADASSSASPPPLFDAWCFAIEMPSSPITNLLEVGVNALISDRCAAGLLLLGEANALDAGSTQNAPLFLSQDGEVLATGSIDTLVDPLYETGIAFCRQARSMGFDLTGGQWISTGGLSPCVPLSVGQTITLLADDKEVLNFVLERSN